MLAAAAWAGECVAESYAILSLVGDRVSVIGEQQQTGSRLDQGQRQILQLPHAGLDDYAARIAYATISKARPTATVDAYRAEDRTPWNALSPTEKIGALEAYLKTPT